MKLKKDCTTKCLSMSEEGEKEAERKTTRRTKLDWNLEQVFKKTKKRDLVNREFSV